MTQCNTIDLIRTILNDDRAIPSYSHSEFSTDLKHSPRSRLRRFERVRASDQSNASFGRAGGIGDAIYTVLHCIARVLPFPVRTIRCTNRQS